MELPRQALKELVDPRNRDVVATNTPKLWASYRRSMNRAQYLLGCGYARQAAKILALNEAMFQTASMGGAGMLALRDAAIGSKSQANAVGVQQPQTSDGVPHL